MGTSPFRFNKYITPCFSTIWKNCLHHTSTPSKKTPPYHRLIAPPQGFTVPCMEATHGFFLRSTEFRPQQRSSFFAGPNKNMVKPTRNQLRLKVDVLQVSLAMRFIRLSMRHSWLLRFLLCSLSTALTCTKGSGAKLWYLWIKWKSYNSLPSCANQQKFQTPRPAFFGRYPFILQLPKTHATNLDQSSPPSLVPHPRSTTHWREDFEKYHHSVEDTQEAPGKGAAISTVGIRSAGPGELISSTKKES